MAPAPNLNPNETRARGSAVRVENLTKRFGGVTAVDDVSFALAPGEALAVIGPNGAGKSSLLKLLSGAYRPDAGEVWCGEVAISQAPPYAVAGHGIGLASQIPRPFKGLTVRENVTVGAMGRHGARRTRARDAHVESILETCGLAAKAAMPASALRLLDLKRLELARALSVDPTLILLDEVAGGLNGTELSDLIELIRDIHRQGRTLILVEHVEGVVASLVERVLVLDWGKVIADGTPDEVSADPRVREVYLGSGAPSAPARAHAPIRTRKAAPPLLAASGLTAGYGDITALREVGVEVGEGEIVAVLGANGAGKSTLAAVLSGALRPRRSSIRFAGREISQQPAHVRNRAGIAHCPEGRKIFSELTVRENLLVATGPRRGKQIEARIEGVYGIFPALQDLASRRAGALSGGQQQMLAIARALMSQPRLLICDEISLGLAPVAIDALYQALIDIRERGVSVLLIEQNVHRSLAIADHAYVLERGRVSFKGAPEFLAEAGMLEDSYFGTAHTLPTPSDS